MSADREYLARRARLGSELGQAEKAMQATIDPQLRLLADELVALKSDNPTDRDLLTMHRIEAELCLFKPRDLLYPTWTRLRSKLYRFEEDRRQSWDFDLNRLIPDAQTVTDEPVLRQRLRQLTYELFEEAEAFNRLTGQRSRVIRNLAITGIVILVLLLATEGLAVGFLSGPATFRRFLLAVSLTRAIGAVASSVSTAPKEKTRDEFLRTLQWDIGARGILSDGIFYGPQLCCRLLRHFVWPDSQ